MHLMFNHIRERVLGLIHPNIDIPISSNVDPPLRGHDRLYYNDVTCMHTYMYMCVYVCVYVYVCMCMCVCVYVYVCMCMCVCVCVYVWMYV